MLDIPRCGDADIRDCKYKAPALLTISFLLIKLIYNQKQYTTCSAWLRFGCIRSRKKDLNFLIIKI